ncbi:MAG: helix-turn-helix transcriptional regulator [Anaerocolumna sp.]
MGRIRVGNPKVQYKPRKLHKLEYYRLKFGLSQEAMADLLGVCLSTYNQKVNGRQSFKIDEMFIIHTFFNQKSSKEGSGIITLDQIFLD